MGVFRSVQIGEDQHSSIRGHRGAKTRITKPDGPTSTQRLESIREEGHSSIRFLTLIGADLTLIDDPQVLNASMDNRLDESEIDAKICRMLLEINKTEGYQFMSAAFEVYNEQGSGMAEEIYQESLELELAQRAIGFCSKPEL